MFSLARKLFTNRSSPIFWGLLLLTYSTLNWRPLSAMADTWWNTTAYAHCLLIPLISAWMIYRKRHTLAAIELKPCWPALALVLLFSALGLIGNSANIQLAEQLAALFTLISLVILVGGLAFSRQLAFPLGYLVFAVPFGEQLVPWLQQLTANISVYGLQLTGIPVFRNGLFIEIPNGKFLVAEACSGMRYLVVALAIGSLFGYLNYHSARKRMLFCLVAIAVAIIANGIRAYLTIMIAHLTDMQYGTGDTYHFAVGWSVYAIIMLILFWIGAYWVDRSPTNTKADPAVATQKYQPVVLALAAAVVVMATAAALAERINHRQNSVQLAALSINAAGWSHTLFATDWQPQYGNAHRVYKTGLVNETGDQIDLFIADYAFERQGEELIQHSNLLYRKNLWTLARSGQTTIDTVAGERQLNWQEIRHLNGSSRLLWYGYQVDERHTPDKLMAKLYRGLYSLFLQQPLSRIVIISTRNDDARAAMLRLSEFTEKHWQQLDIRQFH